jgi:AraC-like DNA-binding protein
MSKVPVLRYYSYGHIETIANAVAEGARQAAVHVDVERQRVPEEIARKSHHKDNQVAPTAKVEDLAAYDAIVIGAGTRFGGLPPPMANFPAQAGGPWMRGVLHGKAGGAFTSSGAQHGGPTTHRFDQVRLRRVLDYISMNLDKEITLAQLAAVAALSVFHFARTFTRAMGVSPHRYVSRMRLQNAMAELAAGKLSLAEIAFNARFSSQASFTRAFNRASGLTPGAYRALRRQ